MGAQLPSGQTRYGGDGERQGDDAQVGVLLDVIGVRIEVVAVDWRAKIAW